MNILNNPLLLSFISIVIGSFLLLLGIEFSRIQRIISLSLVLVSILFAILAFWQISRASDGSFGAFLLTSITTSNFAIVLQRINSMHHVHS